ncbi:MAG: 4Fe-4S dicluster domain-containing protein [Syntrophomonadaceae bacterium]|nr:4Fe-4S dicluster domain-containing protein [Syntrophomonadaceae bacterium]MDD3024298.1 4Fe-4S dicluster domain-containing protein [Syntrophomonadaceae bacterium]
MKDISNKIREIAQTLFKEKKIDVFLGWEKGALDFQTVPFIARSEADARKLVFDEYSIHNLATLLLKFRDGSEKIGIAAKGCDSRSIVRLLEDKQFARERLHIIGVGCPGMKDPLQAIGMYSGLKKQQGDGNALAAKCYECVQPNPVIYDDLVGSQQPSRLTGERFARVNAMEQMNADERYRFFEDTLSKCIRCYACRQVCPACNCRTCIFDEMKPQWVGRENSPEDNMMYHLVKASHMAGRCVECGECERVCPVNIPLMLLNQKLIKDVNTFFGPYEAGMNYVEGAKPPLSSYSEKDPDDFI